MVPALETERLRLRAHRASDLASMVAMWADPLVTRYISGKPSTEQQTWARLCAYAGHWSFAGFGYWAVEERAGGDYVGELGFANFHRDVATELRELPELGWGFASRVHGRGIATEATRAVVAWGDRHLAAGRTMCLIAPDNLASLAIAAKLGFERYADGAVGDLATTFFVRSRPTTTTPPHSTTR